MLLSLPHTHTDASVPQEEIACSAAHSGSLTFHLHSEGVPLESHECLACLAGSTFGASGESHAAPATLSISPAATVEPPACRSLIHAYLPNLRAPPRVV